jgi:hypothetical protein
MLFMDSMTSSGLEPFFDRDRPHHGHAGIAGGEQTRGELPVDARKFRVEVAEDGADTPIGDADGDNGQEADDGQQVANDLHSNSPRDDVGRLIERLDP